MLEMFETLMIQIIAITWLPVAIVGGIVAYKKDDYFSRGFATIALTWVFGLIFLLKAPRSKAKEGDQDDYKNWHSHASTGGVWIFAMIVLYVLIKAIT